MPTSISRISKKPEAAIGILDGLLNNDADGIANTIAINQMLADYWTVMCSEPGTYNFAPINPFNTSDGTNVYRVAILIPSDTKLVLGDGVEFRIADGYLNPCLIRNSNISTGNSNIAIEGGIWNGNRAQSTREDAGFAADVITPGKTFCCMTIWTQNIRKLRTKGVQVVNPKAWGWGVAACQDAFLEGTLFNYSGGVMNTGNQGGYQLQGPNNHIYIKDTVGNTYDDLVAIVTDVGVSSTDIFYVNTMAGYGPVNNVIIDGVASNETSGCWQHVRIFDSTTHPARNVVIQNVTGPYANAAVAIGSANQTSAISLVENLVINNLSCRQLNLSMPSAGMIDINGPFNSITCNNINRRVRAGEGSRNTFRFVQMSGGSIIQGTSFIANNVVVRDEGSSSDTALVGVSLANGTIKSILLSNIEYRWTSSVSASNSQLIALGGSSTTGAINVVNFYTDRIRRLFQNAGAEITKGVYFANGVADNCSASAILTLAAAARMPVLGLSNVNFTGIQPVTSGVINFNGMGGTTAIYLSNVKSDRVASSNIQSTAASNIRVVGICPDFAVASTIVNAPLAGDCFSDALASNAPIKCSTSGVMTFTLM